MAKASSWRSCPLRSVEVVPTTRRSTPWAAWASTPLFHTLSFSSRRGLVPLLSGGEPLLIPASCGQLLRAADRRPQKGRSGVGRSECLRQRVLARASVHARRWLASVGTRRVGPVASADEIVEKLGGPLPPHRPRPTR